MGDDRAAGRLRDHEGEAIAERQPVTGIRVGPRVRIAQFGRIAKCEAIPLAAVGGMHARGLLRALLRGLADGAADPARCLTVDDLLAIGWPGEKMARSSALNRLYVALATLRSLGLRDVIVRKPEGYALHARVRCA